MIKNIIKIVLILVISMRYSHSYAQTIDSTYWEKQDKLFENMSKNGITVLYDRVFNWADLSNFDPQQDTLSFDYEMQAWHELYLATYNRNGLYSSSEIRNIAIRNELDDKGISIGYIRYEYDEIDTLAFQNGYLVINPNDSLIYDGTNPEKAYRKQTIILPIVATDKLQEGKNTFYFDSKLILENLNLNEDISITLKSGSNSISIVKGQSKDLDIALIPGTETIDFKVEIVFPSSGTSIFPHHGFIPGLVGTMNDSKTTEYCTSGKNDKDIWSGDSLKFKGYDESIATEGKGEYKIYYKMNSTAKDDCGTKKITKPIIIIDGFDPKNKERESCDDIWALLSYPGGHFGDRLRTSGYDVIVLNFPEYKGWHPTKPDLVRDGGADYIERNAMVLTKLIQNVNDSLVANGSSEGIVVLGPSMGGQIARYALAYMEKEDAAGKPKMNHNVRLWVSFDSPHLGANIPLSLQESIYFIGHDLNKEDAKESYDNQLYSKAARQMLIEQRDGEHGTATFHSTYYNNSLVTNGLPGSNGWPMNLRKISVINGTASGIKTGVEGAKILDVYSGSLVKMIKVKAYNMPEYSDSINPYFSVGGFKFELFFIGIEFYKSISGGKTNYNSHGSMDVVPGGMFNTAEVLWKQIEKGADDYGIGTYGTTLEKHHSFIPSVSSLAFKNPNFNWSVPFNDRNLVCTDEIPFDNYFTARFNENHVDLSRESVAWLIEEIEYGKQGCPNICSNKLLQVGGDHFLCPEVNYTFQLDESVDIGDTTHWEVSAGIAIISSNNNQIKVKYSPALLVDTFVAGPGEDMEEMLTPANRFIRAIITPRMSGEQCAASKTITKSIDYGKLFKHKINSNDVSDPQFRVEVVPHIAGSLYAWKKDDFSEYSSLLTGYTRDYYKVNPDSLPKYFYTKIYTAGCSMSVPTQILKSSYAPIAETSTVPTIDTFPSRPQKWDNEEVLLKPNPTEDIWNIILTQEWTDQTVRIRLISIDGKELETINTIGQQVISIDASQLKSGVYLIELINGREQKILKAVKR